MRLAFGATTVRGVLWVILGILVLAPLAAILIGAIRPDFLGAATTSNLLSATLWSATRNSLFLGVGVGTRTGVGDGRLGATARCIVGGFAISAFF